ncbi:MAG TPA: DNA-processing protein DprA, partial [Phenylobacterium sp.]
VSLLNRPSVALVGARIASAGGQRFARGLASDLGAQGFVIVSGMARGIDGAAHEGALPTGTVAVLGGGIDDIYPSEHRSLYERLVEEGCVVSESAPGRTATAKDFPRRNRIISGLSRAVVVVEAELRSGSLITARLAAEQGREVLAVPGSPLDPRARGTNDLIRQGAALCEGVDDVLRALEGVRGLREPECPFAPAPVSDAAIDGVREKVAALLSPTPVSRDELVRAAGAPAPVVLAALTELALAGRAELLPGGLVALA